MSEFAETQALVHVLNEDDEAAEEALLSMAPAELTALIAACTELAGMARAARHIVRKRRAEGSQ